MPSDAFQQQAAPKEKDLFFPEKIPYRVPLFYLRPDGLNGI